MDVEAEKSTNIDVHLVKTTKLLLTTVYRHGRCTMFGGFRGMPPRLHTQISKLSLPTPLSPQDVHSMPPECHEEPSTWISMITWNRKSEKMEVFDWVQVEFGTFFDLL